MKLRWLASAMASRDAQLDDIARDNPLAAVEQGDRIHGQVEPLLEQPNMGRPGRAEKTRELVIGRTPFIVVYLVRPRVRRIELIRLLHGSQQ